MQLPLYRNDGIAILPLTLFQHEALTAIRIRMDSGELKLVPNGCICGNPKPQQDETVSEKDRYGLPIPMLLCGRCGLVRCAKVFDSDSNLEFYRHFYRSLYVGSKQAPEHFFKEQVWRGKRLAEALKRSVPDRKLDLVFEVGCGAGGILFPFRELAGKCSGCDFDQNYLDFGIRKGLDLAFGDFEDILPADSADVIILSHVLEHFTDPLGITEKIIRKIKPGGFLLVEVPSLLNIHRVYFNPILYFQNAHCFNFCAEQLKVFAAALGLEVAYGDETCIFVLRKPEGWAYRGMKTAFDPALSAFPDLIRKYLLQTDFSHRYRVNPLRWKSMAVKAMRESGLNQLRRKLLGKEVTIVKD